MLDYEMDCKAVYADKLASDLKGKGRVESAGFHTAKHIYLKGVEDGGLTAKMLKEAMEAAGGKPQADTIKGLLDEIAYFVRVA